MLHGGKPRWYFPVNKERLMYDWAKQPTSQGGATEDDVIAVKGARKRQRVWLWDCRPQPPCCSLVPCRGTRLTLPARAVFTLRETHLAPWIILGLSLSNTHSSAPCCPPTVLFFLAWITWTVAGIICHVSASVLSFSLSLWSPGLWSWLFGEDISRSKCLEVFCYVTT